MRLAADANVLLSAVVGGRARSVLGHAGVEEVLTTATTLAELQEYLPHLARKKRLALETLLPAVASLPVTVVPREVYAGHVREAMKRIGKRDPDDVELLALALRFGVPIWSNDNDFEDARVEWFTTAELLRRLERS